MGHLGDHYIPQPGEAVDIECWCTRTVTRVSLEDAQAGRTRSCGHSVCYPANFGFPLFSEAWPIKED